MKRWIARSIVIALAIVLMAGGAATGYFWHLGADLISRARTAGWTVAVDSAPLSVFEQTVAKSMFAESWNRSGFPCRTIMDLSSGRPTTRVAAEVTRDMLMDAHAERTLEASLARVSASCQLEMAHSDTQLLRLWLGHVHLAGHEGAETAAQGLFGKALHELDEAESARMVALVYDPGVWKRPEQWTKRADYMLAQARQYAWVGDRLERGSGQTE